MVGGDAIHVAGLIGQATEEVAAADHHGDLRAQGVDILQFGGNLVNAVGIHSEALTGGEGFAGKLKQDAMEDRSHKYGSCGG